MATDHAPLSHDLRGPALDYKRDRTQAAKWALGEKIPIGESPSLQTQFSRGLAEGTRRPIQPSKPIKSARTQWFIRGQCKRPRQSNKFARVDDQISAGSEDDDDVKVALEIEAAESCPDEGITYSFDAATGPGRGSHVLGAALTDAVQRFEGKQTEKLVKDEYEVVRPESPALGPTVVLDGLGSADLDGFELV